MPGTFETYRPRLRALAYRMLGTRSDAEDVVQDAWLRWQAQDPAQVHDALAYLCRTTTHLCLDHLQSARVRHERYMGLWLPEPLVDGQLLDYCTGPEAALGQTQQLRMAFLMALQALSPLERAAFLLHDVFEQPFEEVARSLGRSPPSCRQLAARARKRLAQARAAEGDDGPTPAPDDPRTARLLAAFAQAIAEGDLQALADLLAEDVHLYSDGGGVVCAVPHPLAGRERVAQTLMGFARNWQRDVAGAQALRAALVNGEPGALLWDAQGRLEQVCALSLDARGRVRGIYFQRNPHKLQGVGAELAPLSQ